MRRTILAFAASLPLVGLPTAALRAEAPPSDFARGASLYSANCARCHNARGPGEHSDAVWPLIVTHMRVVAGLPGEQARLIEQFLRASNNPPPTAVPAALRPTDLSGADLIQRYGCRGCHRIGAAGGGMVGPRLDDVFERRSEEWIYTQIKNPRDNNPKTVMPQFGFTHEQVKAIVEALRAGGL
jgi:mono/diheme cytochrome c family protein